jgi:hypothetical protein
MPQAATSRASALAEADHAAESGGIVWPASARLPGLVADDVDDAAIARLLHWAQGRATDSGSRHGASPQDLIPLFKRHLSDWRIAHGGMGRDQGVEAIPAAQRFFNQVVHSGLVADIGPNRDQTIITAQQIDQLLSHFIALTVAKEHPRAMLDQPGHDLAPETAGSTSDNRNLIGKIHTTTVEA